MLLIQSSTFTSLATGAGIASGSGWESMDPPTDCSEQGYDFGTWCDFEDACGPAYDAAGVFLGEEAQRDGFPCPDGSAAFDMPVGHPRSCCTCDGTFCALPTVDTPSPTEDTTDDPPTDTSFNGPCSCPSGCTNDVPNDSTEVCMHHHWGPLSEMRVDRVSGKNKETHSYVFTNLGESCHHACMRFGETVGETWYCDDNSMFNVHSEDGTETNVNVKEIVQTVTDGRCTMLYPGKTRTVGKQKNAWAPYMTDSSNPRCHYGHFRGKHKCYVTRTNNYRLCGCQQYADLWDEEYVPNSNIAPIQGTQGWAKVSDQNCDQYCTSIGSTCNTDVLNGFKGAYDMRALERLMTGGAMDLCDMWDDRINKAKNPTYRDTDKHCYVNSPDSNGMAECGFKSNTPDYRFCYCGDAMPVEP